MTLQAVPPTPELPADAFGTAVGLPGGRFLAPLEELRRTVDSRTQIGQATGLMASEANLSLAEAGTVLRILAQATGHRVHTVAQVFVDAHEGRSTLDPRTITTITDLLGMAINRAREHHATPCA